MTSVGIIGAGAWGTALACAASRAGSEVTLWCHEEKVAHDIITNNKNTLRLPELDLVPNIIATTDIEQACLANIIVMATPAKFLRTVSEQISPLIKDEAYILIASKGIETETGLLLSQVLKQTIPQRTVGVLSGPSFADEVVRNMLTTVTLAERSITSANWLARAFTSKNFRITASDDVIGAQIGGALKNILAIASGILVGMQYGRNAQAALITHGMAEITQLAIALGGKVETINGLSGLGDIWLTCTSTKSRNFSFGKQVGEGQSPQDILKSAEYAIEGTYTAKAGAMLAQKHEVAMPICQAVNAVVNEGSSVDSIIDNLVH